MNDALKTAPQESELTQTAEVWRTAPSIESEAAGPDLQQFSDGELLDAWTNDQLAEAFATLVNRYGAMVLSVCRRKCRSNSDADDA
ncbi:MAG: sigma-70 family RNA polymerase sigma factor, partial [Planctomycetota bacterium]